jgi:hypothetical protein
MSDQTTNMDRLRHAWRFFRAGGFDQVRLDLGADIAALDQLDQKLWVALSCPTRGLEFDSKTLDLIDTDHDGRIRAPEIIAAAKWACGLTKNPDDLLKSSPELPLSAIDDSTPEGAALLASARQILSDLGKPDAASIGPDDTADTTRIFALTRFNGDGIVPADSSDDPEVQAVIGEIITCLGSETDRSGKPGVSQARVDQFFADLQTCSDWWGAAEGESGVLVLGDATAAAEGMLSKVRTKVDDYFARCKLAAFDARAQAALNRQESDYLDIAAKDLTITATEIAALPLSRIEAGRPLLLSANLNPAWAEAVAEFRDGVVVPLLGQRQELTEVDWDVLKTRFAAFEAWSAVKPGSPAVEKLGLDRIRAILSGRTREAIAALIVKDKALESMANAIASVDRLVRYHRDLYKLLVNFVSFRDFYGRKTKAIFQIGTLYLDQRSCDLCVRVDDMVKHGTMVHLSQTYLAYCDVVRKSTGEKMTIAAAFTRGHSDNLMVGRNGIFYDRQGRDWDATITKIVENPVSIVQAFWTPYKRALRWIEDQVAKRAAAADASATSRLTSAAQMVEQPPAAGAPAAPPKPKIDIGTLAAIGVAIGGITTAMGILLAAFFSLGWLMPLGIAGLILVISLPSMVIAWLKLRQRNLGPILDANGWAVNAKAKINIPFGKVLTGIAVLPPGSKRDLVDPYAEKTWHRWVIALVVVLLLTAVGLWYFGVVEKNLWPGCPWPSPYVERQKEAEAKAKAEAAKAATTPTGGPAATSTIPAATPSTPVATPTAPPTKGATP